MSPPPALLVSVSPTCCLLHLYICLLLGGSSSISSRHRSVLPLGAHCSAFRPCPWVASSVLSLLSICYASPALSRSAGPPTQVPRGTP